MMEQRPDRILICGLNWLGDSVMSMPAVQAHRRLHPDCRITMLVKPPLADLWAMHESVHDVIVLEDGVGGILRAAGRIRALAFPTAFVFPNSPRAALPPFIGGVPVRRGGRGKHRAWLLTDIVARHLADIHWHQSWEYADILGLSEEDCGEGAGRWRPELRVPDEAAERVAGMLESPGTGQLIALVPGAARGPSKRWPAGHFTEVGRRLAGVGRRVAVLGTRAEIDMCAGIADGIGSAAVSIAGKTTMPEMAAVLRSCSAAVTNDSGGMHLATAVRCPVVAVFGLTDPTRTGPMGPDHRVIAGEGVAGARDVPRSSAAAAACLSSITPDRVYGALEEVLRGEQ